VVSLDSRYSVIDNDATAEKVSSLSMSRNSGYNEPHSKRIDFGRKDLLIIIRYQPAFTGPRSASIPLCMPGSNGDEVLSEEAVHLAAGMLFAGYR
jgi:hypothetical protein